MNAKTDNFENAGAQNCSKLIHVPLCYQETEFTCGVACVQSLLARYGMIYSQTALAHILNSQPVLGTDYQGILQFVKMLGLESVMYENMEIEDIKRYIDDGVTPMLVLQAWKTDEIEYRYDWKDAHYVIACGYFDKGIYVMDPYTLGNYTFITFPELIDRWHAVDKFGTRHFRSGLVVFSAYSTTKYKSNEIKHMG